MHFIWDGLPFWCELKVAKSNAVNISAHQVAWNTAYWVRGGANFILVKSLKDRDLILFDGDQGADLIKGGVSAAQGSRFKDPASLFCALRPRLERRISATLRPCDSAA